MSVPAFLFGKLPAHGDFVARGLSDPEREAWDAWSSQALDALRGAAGAGFDDAHGAAPPWRFVVGEGLRWKAGALAPSMDGAGRRYLLAVGVDGLTPLQAAACGLMLAAEAEQLIYEGLAQGFSADTLTGMAADRFAGLLAQGLDAAAALGAAPAVRGVWWTLGSETFAPLALPRADAPADLFARTVHAFAPAFVTGPLETV